MDIKCVIVMFENGVSKFLVFFNMIMICEILNIVDNCGYERCYYFGFE